MELFKPTIQKHQSESTGLQVSTKPTILLLEIYPKEINSNNPYDTLISLDDKKTKKITAKTGGKCKGPVPR